MIHDSRSKIVTVTAVACIFSAVGILGTWYYHGTPESILRKRSKSQKIDPRCFSSTSKPSLEHFKTLTQQTTQRRTYPLASKIDKNIPVYDCNTLDLKATDQLDKLQDEFYQILTAGPGIFILKHFFPTTKPLDSANQAYENIIHHEKLNQSGVKGDHFAPASTNTRIWNSFSKHALQDPTSFIHYFSNPWFRLVSESYLGPNYRLTTQVNIVHAGGKAQMPHRDYHLGFQTDEEVVKWPKAVHDMSKFLTLQGAVAHSDMPLESGPTRVLPYSHLFDEGFRSFRRREFIEYFEQQFVALPLEKGDAMFFNPALFHAAGENCTEGFSRSANLIQVSSAFGKPMESIDTLEIIKATYATLRAESGRGAMSREELESFICNVAEGYPFPTNLDCRPPAPGGQAPESDQAIMRRGFSERWDEVRMLRELTEMRKASSASV